MRAGVVVHHEMTVLTQQLPEAAIHPVEVGDMVAGSVVDDEVVVANGELGGVRIEPVVLDRVRSGHRRARVEKILQIVDGDDVFHRARIEEVAFDPAGAAVEGESHSLRAAEVLGDEVPPRPVGVVEGPLVEVADDFLVVVPIRQLVVDGRVRGVRHRRTVGP